MTEDRARARALKEGLRALFKRLEARPVPDRLRSLAEQMDDDEREKENWNFQSHISPEWKSSQRRRGARSSQGKKGMFDIFHHFFFLPLCVFLPFVQCTMDMMVCV